ncbi:hypothetical protein BBF96_09710 [Anoxybacter fermentans]|uniref:Methyltransferase type 11 domain-containing protein n=1 Tax=Anoxybacter fermentans TaxID=1323375 RepID=A0A3Q9HQQ4_9FIRM|nr:class I SAM-dependent methyltransferase [Anoxybacter fermentans]AZR73638.1 hypothetical protein BBF96_09710 [Anoxybacter fermentans]
MSKIQKCRPGQVVEILGDHFYKVRLLDGDTGKFKSSSIMMQKKIKIEVGQWVAIANGYIIFRWKEIKSSGEVNWEKMISSIPAFAFESRGCHDSQAENYDEMVRSNINDYIRENYFEILDRVIELADFKQGMKVLEIGIGTGLLTERMPEGLKIFGIDISEKMMEKVREKKLSVQLTKGSFCDIPFSDNSFDRILSTFAFHHLTPEEKEIAFVEMDRVLRPQGCIVIGDFMFENDEQKNKLIERFINEDRTDMLEEFEDEYFTNIEDAISNLERLGYEVGYERGSTISWILKAVKKDKNSMVITQF